MDAGLLLAGVSTVAKPPGAPPGKEIETPPVEARNEFENVLKQAEGKSSGEVAEAEPNAQPQKLDSTEESTETKAETMPDWAELLGFAVVSPQLVVPADAMALVEVSAQAPLQAEALIATPASEVVHALPESVSVGALPLNSEVATELNIVAVSTKQTQTPPEGQEVGSDLSDTIRPQGIPERPKIVPQVLPSSVKIAPTQVEPKVQQQTVTQSLTKVPEETLLNSKDLAPAMTAAMDTAETTLTHESFIADFVNQPEAGFEDGQQSQSGSSFGGQGQSGQPEFRAVSVETTEKVEQSMALTSTERRAVVHQLTQKIEALAVNSVRNQVTVRMEPAELGTVLVQVSKGIEGLTASLCASDETLQATLHETKNELAAALTAKSNATVRVEVISADSTPMGTSSDANRQSSPQQQPRQEAVTRFFQPKTSETNITTSPSRPSLDGTHRPGKLTWIPHSSPITKSWDLLQRRLQTRVNLSSIPRTSFNYYLFSWQTKTHWNQ